MNIKRKPEEKVSELFKSYIVKKAIMEGLADPVKYREFNNVDLDYTKDRLLNLCKDVKAFAAIESTLFKNAYLDLFLELSVLQKNIYKEHFRKNEVAYCTNLSAHITEVMVIIKSMDESEVLDYTEQDYIIDTDRTKKVSKFCMYRNYYMAIRNCYQELADKIYNSAKIEYSLYTQDMILINNSFRDLYLVYKSLKTTPGKLQIINLFWELTKISGYTINYSQILEYKDDLFKILINCILEDNKLLFDNITLIFYAVFSIKDHDEEVIEIKSRFLDIIEKFGNK